MLNGFLLVALLQFQTGLVAQFLSAVIHIHFLLGCLSDSSVGFRRFLGNCSRYFKTLSPCEGEVSQYAVVQAQPLILMENYLVKLSFLQSTILTQLFAAQYPRDDGERPYLKMGLQGVCWESIYFQQLHSCSRHAVSSALHSLANRKLIDLKSFSENTKRTEFVQLTEEAITRRDEIDAIFTLCLLQKFVKNFASNYAKDFLREAFPTHGNLYVHIDGFYSPRRRIVTTINAFLSMEIENKMEKIRELINNEVSDPFKQQLLKRNAIFAENLAKSLPKIIRAAELPYLSRQRLGQLKLEERSRMKIERGA